MYGFQNQQKYFKKQYTMMKKTRILLLQTLIFVAQCMFAQTSGFQKLAELEVLEIYDEKK
jgi:hypothetical protein